MATTRPDLADDHGLPAVGVHFAGQIGEPLIVIEAAILSPEDAITYAQRIFAAAASACRRSRQEAVAGHA